MVGESGLAFITPLKDESDADLDDYMEDDNNNGASLIAECKVALDEVYILHISGTSERNCTIAVGTSNNSCEIYNFDDDHLAKLDSIEYTSNIVDIKFCCENNNLIYIASVDRGIKLWDLRCLRQAATEFVDISRNASEESRPISCFDISSDNRLLAAGTELYNGESFILFWDVRNIKLLGGYWESHTDDITELKFHPEDKNKLASGSIDGLMNIYDLKQEAEENALIDSLNTESSVEHLLWYIYKNKDCLACITHTADLQLWRTDMAEPYNHFKRSQIADAIKRKTASYSYLINAHNYNNDQMFFLAGSNWNDGEFVRGIWSNDTKLKPVFKLKENKQRIRSSWCNKHYRILATGGEKGILNLWELDINL